jgi:hypothetical protein
MIKKNYKNRLPGMINVVYIIDSDNIEKMIAILIISLICFVSYKLFTNSREVGKGKV